MVGAWAAADTDDTPRSQLSHAAAKRQDFCGVRGSLCHIKVHSGLSEPKPSPGDLPQKHTASLVSVLTAVTRWVPKHPLMLQLGAGKNISVCFIFSGVSFFFRCLQVETTRRKQWSTTRSRLLALKPRIYIPMHIITYVQYDCYGEETWLER